ncbi:FkbM family methyltransferase [Christensenella tenuis]|jgi:FkbM family methyltransferase|uniref:FkbM family methyltransferase n=1 Tax=Christensenella tenuis TaxID=2763033 RepID=A0ABR7EAM0_9FIRM|nr:FkbM family methyltransferase [Christensenella tenuis]MBC5646841.1 FkbM family methyltransferase [Christensenella tenuis]
MEFNENVSLWQRLRQARKPVVLYGMGNGADKILDELARHGIAAAGVFASDEFCRGQMFRGFRVTNYTQAKEHFGEMIVLVAFGTQLPEVLGRVKQIAREQELYIPDVPVYGEGIFDTDYLRLYETELRQAYGLLADDLSRETFRDMVEYKLSGKPEYLYHCESRPAEVCENILKLGNNECYVDVGAYTGDTIRDFVETTDGYGEIFAIEPDERNFVKLKSAVESMEHVTCWNVAACEKDGMIPFAQRGGRNSAASEQERMVPASCLDNLLAGKRVTYIKYDVEGEEESALKGTKHIIKEQRPKLLVSAYHRTEDLFRLPLLVIGMQPDYRVYLRHFPCIPAWDTNYYFV